MTAFYHNTAAADGNPRLRWFACLVRFDSGPSNITGILGNTLRDALILATRNDYKLFTANFAFCDAHQVTFLPTVKPRRNNFKKTRRRRLKINGDLQITAFAIEPMHMHLALPYTGRDIDITAKWLADQGYINSPKYFS